VANMPTVKELQASVRNGISFQTDFIPPLTIVAAHINSLGAKVESFEDPLRKAIKEVVIPSIQTNFDVGGRPKWPPLSDGTIEIRGRLGAGISSSILVLTGALKKTMGEEGIWNVTSDTAELPGFPPNVWYGIIHNSGFDGKGGGQSAKGKSFQWIVKNASKDMPVSPIPARPFAVLQPEDEAKIEDIFMEWLGEKIEEAWPA
jgi:phage gpG-like protein